MGWTTPRTWSSEPLVSTNLNAHVRDNLNYLYDRMANNAVSDIDESSNYSTTSSSFVDVDATEGKFQHTITTSGGDVLIGFAGLVDPGSGFCFLTVAVDGTTHIGDDGIIRSLGSYTVPVPISFTTIVEGLSAGEHVFTLQWKRQSGTANLYAGAGTSNADVHPQFWVQEL